MNVIYLGLVSFFADISAEMVYPIIPLYLTAAFGATPVLIGIIEGIAESLASLLKVFSGYFTDRYKKKKPVAFIGYSTGILYKLVLILAGSWSGILGARAIDRIGKGIRTAPRDVMVSECAQEGSAGKVFGIHKSLDMAGSALGILIAWLLMRNTVGAVEYKQIFAISIIPAVLSLVMFLKIKEKKVICPPMEREPFWKNIKNLDGRLKLYLVAAFLFTLGNSSNTFLLLRAKSVGFSDASVILLYFIYNISASALAIPAGKRSDKVGRKRVLVAGYIVFGIVYFGFAIVTGKSFMIALFILYGVYTAMIAGVERAFISEAAPKNLKGTMLGLHSTIVSIALLPASVIAGILWTTFGARVPFIFGGCMSFLAAGLLLFLLNPPGPSAENVK
ncbi:MFS transporter [Parasporobacterium paucivorans]|uniref:MFS-type transporter involved in bile tolerance, Atg22 family n=1 Tax=Parasporobacterium paucivorans DSM 15970 TaxID=1122934 RepID=A0A1M6GJU4_9FIRM|nr:MFS transporter [Parasporobacterium paucivorans]SHJ10186.1 MFS-type transporter involved in bile tolerance, Atg22 family [Parasporobacterium paucivorans DSM 15970]